MRILAASSFKKWVVEYVLICKGKSAKLKLPLAGCFATGQLRNEREQASALSFLSFGKSRDLKAAGQDSDSVQSYVRNGLLGMLRFGNHKSPILLELLAEVLGEDANATRIAARAILLAARVADENHSQYQALLRRYLADQSEPGSTNDGKLIESIQSDLNTVINCLSAARTHSLSRCCRQNSSAVLAQPAVFS